MNKHFTALKINEILKNTSIGRTIFEGFFIAIRKKYTEAVCLTKEIFLKDK